jgi:hypothetical protein
MWDSLFIYVSIYNQAYTNVIMLTLIQVISRTFMYPDTLICNFNVIFIIYKMLLQWDKIYLQNTCT